MTSARLGGIGVAGDVQVDDLTPVPPAAAQMVADVPAGAQQQPDAAPAPLDQRPQQLAGQVGRVGGLIQGVDHRDQRRAVAAQPGQQRAQAAVQRGRVGVDVLDARGGGQAGQDLAGGQVPRVDGHVDRVRAGDDPGGQPVAGNGRTALRVGQRGEQAQHGGLARAGVTGHDHRPRISRGRPATGRYRPGPGAGR